VTNRKHTPFDLTEMEHGQWFMPCGCHLNSSQMQFYFCDTHQAATDLLEAGQMLAKEPLGDFVYDIRASELLGWDGPRVTNWSAGVVKLLAALAKRKGE